MLLSHLCIIWVWVAQFLNCLVFTSGSCTPNLFYLTCLRGFSSWDLYCGEMPSLIFINSLFSHVYDEPKEINHNFGPALSSCRVAQHCPPRKLHLQIVLRWPQYLKQFRFRHWIILHAQNHGRLIWQAIAMANWDSETQTLRKVESVFCWQLGLSTLLDVNAQGYLVGSSSTLFSTTLARSPEVNGYWLG